ncbi:MULTISPECIES: hypothetical protein [Rhizobium]|uniref:hypothetical protein n=1 Tax=Rhizobium TaxID=379 RepID=UPI001031CC8E|nr:MULTISPECIES: hypothetical protein [Rhizobium]NEJ06237.1 hypothetical protein [Rhizobium ruizarguesonis]QIO58746.1 hypothetical protein HA463_14080 [Rhizobium leguminosarum bv. trifolii]TBA14692.1 hypothetical protein ELH65_01180 [Rhizobium ruizarguesonis]
MNDPEWREWSDREIARRCRVDSKTVAKHRAEIEAHNAEIRSIGMDRTFIYPKTGQPTTMATAGINADLTPAPKRYWGYPQSSTMEAVMP